MKTYCVVYRTGGMINFRWYRTLPVMSYADAMEQRDSVMRQGYHAFIEDYEMSMAAGLPATYKYITPFEE